MLVTTRMRLHNGYYGLIVIETADLDSFPLCTPNCCFDNYEEKLLD